MEILDSIKTLKKYRNCIKGTVGYVPTMGALHKGHVSLFLAAKKACDVTIASVFVNATQFNDPKDLYNYPKTEAKDLAILSEEGVSAVFLPAYDQIYPDDFAYEVNEKSLSLELCGKNRPGHFTGVLTVLMKLFLLIRPDKVFMGEKDYQQLELARGLVRSFHLNIEIQACPTIREPDGLAMSSRNKNLSLIQRQQAPLFYEILSRPGSDEEISEQLVEEGFDIDYVISKHRRRYGAIVIGSGEKRVRLIDNVLVK